jgi:hypothetical protein
MPSNWHKINKVSRDNRRQGLHLVNPEHNNNQPLRPIHSKILRSRILQEQPQADDNEEDEEAENRRNRVSA